MERDKRTLSILRLLYAGYDHGSFTKRIHRRLCGSQSAVRLIFGVRIDPSLSPPPRKRYFDLTTICLWWTLRRMLRNMRGARVLEVGVGPYAVLCRALGPLTSHTISGCDLPEVAATATRHVRHAGADVQIFASDILSTVPTEPYDLVFWNLPYRTDPEGYLPQLFSQVDGYPAPLGRLVIGYNALALPRENVIAILRRNSALEVESVKTWWWNAHEVLVIRPKLTDDYPA